MKKPEIKYVGWCHVCKYLGSFICGNCNPGKKYSFGKPSEFISLRSNDTWPDRTEEVKHDSN